MKKASEVRGVRNLFNSSGRLVALMGVLFTGIIVITGIVAIMMGDGQIPPLFASSSSSQEDSSQSQ